MATAPIANRRSLAPAAPPQAAPPPVQEEQQDQTLFDYLYACITAVDPNFVPQQDNEDDQVFLRRMVEFIAPGGGFPEESWATWEQDAPEAQQWYNDAVTAMGQGKEIPAPDGYYLVDEEQVQQTAPPQTSAPVGKPGTPGVQPTGLAKWHQQQREQKAAAAGSNGRASNGQHAPAAIPPRAPPPAARTAPPPATTAPVIPPRRNAAPQQPVYTPPQPVAPPARRTAPPAQAQSQQGQQIPQRRQAPAAPQAPASGGSRQRAARGSQEMLDQLRAQVIYDPELTTQQLIEYARSIGSTQVDSSIGAIVSQGRVWLNLLERMGRLAPPPA